MSSKKTYELNEQYGCCYGKDVNSKKNEITEHCGCPSKCFCKYDEQELKQIGYKKFIRRIPTLELMKAAKTAREKELISVVSMLDLDGAVSEIMIREKMSGESCDVIGCRENLKKRLFEVLTIVEKKLFRPFARTMSVFISLWR